MWLLAGSAYLLLRCLLDLILVRRPALAPNVNFGGLAWLTFLFRLLGIWCFQSRVEGEDQPEAPAREVALKVQG